MKCGVIGLVSMLFVLAGGVPCAGNTLGVYADPQGLDCNIVDNHPRFLVVYVVHVSPAGATAAQFSAPMPACMSGATYLSDTVWFAVGNSQTGISVLYGSCQTGAIHVMSINYFVQGTSEVCCEYPLLPDPYPSAGGEILVQDCDFNTVPAVGLTATVNGDATCVCGYPVPVEETTWGSVKALYAE